MKSQLTFHWLFIDFLFYWGSYMRQIRVTRYSTRGDKRREADKNVHERKQRLDNEIALELCSLAWYVLRPGPLGLDSNKADHVLGHMMAGTPARRARVFSSGTRAWLTTIHASSAFSLFLLHGLGCFRASHGVDCDSSLSSSHPLCDLYPRLSLWRSDRIVPFAYQVGCIRKKSALAPHIGPKSGQHLTSVTHSAFILATLYSDIRMHRAGAHPWASSTRGNIHCLALICFYVILTHACTL